LELYSTISAVPPKKIDPYYPIEMAKCISQSRVCIAPTSKNKTETYLLNAEDIYLISFFAAQQSKVKKMRLKMIVS
jgi:hypothetical protein